MSDPVFIEGGIGPIALHDLGGAGDDVLIVCHATGFLGRVYRAFAAELTDHVRVVAIDFRAHGDSATPDDIEEFNWSGMADDLTAAINHLDARTLHGFGHSMGGAALLETERRLPGTFSSALVFEPIVPAGMFSDTGESPLSRAARGRLRSFPTRAEALQRYASRPPLDLFRADVLSDYVQHGFRDGEDGVTLKCLPESEANTFTMAGRIHLGLMPEIELDVRIGRSGDGQLPAQLAAAVAEALPNGQLLDFPTITHFGPLQDPVTVALAMIETMEGVS
jgi:pimeloyl-ACP methyl ester carboxylesterase